MMRGGDRMLSTDAMFLVRLVHTRCLFRTISTGLKSRMRTARTPSHHTRLHSSLCLTQKLASCWTYGLMHHGESPHCASEVRHLPSHNLAIVGGYELVMLSLIAFDLVRVMFSVEFRSAATDESENTSMRKQIMDWQRNNLWCCCPSGSGKPLLDAQVGHIRTCFLPLSRSCRHAAIQFAVYGCLRAQLLYCQAHACKFRQMHHHRHTWPNPSA
jgi:hypothetical protein